MLRVLEAWRARAAATPPAPPVQPPPAGTRARLAGHLSGGGDLGEWTLDERAPLDEAITGALGLDPRSAGSRVEITAHVLGESEGDAGRVRAEHSAPTMNTQQRPITTEQYRRLGEIGALGEGIELIDGYVVSGRFPLVFSAEAIAAARAAGIDLTTREPLDILADGLYDLICELAREGAGEVSYSAERLHAMRSRVRELEPVAGERLRELLSQEDE